MFRARDNTGRKNYAKKIAICAPRTNLSGYVFAIKAINRYDGRRLDIDY